MSDHLLKVSNAIEQCASAAADAIVDGRPELDRERIQRAMSQELWMATTDMGRLAQSGAILC